MDVIRGSIISVVPRAIRALMVIPVTWFLINTLINSVNSLLAVSPKVSLNIYYLIRSEFLKQAMLTAISGLGLSSSIAAMAGSSTGLAIAYVSYVVIFCAGSAPSTWLAVLIVTGLILYLPLDVLSRFWRGGNYRFKIGLSGVMLTMVFEAVKIGIPLILAWFILGFYSTILHVGFTPSPGISMLWDILAHTVVGRLLVFIFVASLGAYLSGELMNIITTYATPSLSRVRMYALSMIKSMKSSLTSRWYPSKLIVRSITFLASIYLYPFALIVAKDVVGKYFPWFLSSVINVSLPIAIANVAAGATVLAATYAIMRVLINSALLGVKGWRSLIIASSVTGFLIAYFVIFHHANPPLLGSGKPTELDKELINGYYSFYSSLLSIFRYVMYGLGVTP